MMGVDALVALGIYAAGLAFWLAELASGRLSSTHAGMTARFIACAVFIVLWPLSALVLYVFGRRK